ncbi:hypothetical protein MMC22_012010, partial [Lobaria immixta]|nr:hypothetical protein [Lobaria immixta]
MKFTYQIGIAALFGSFAVTAPANTLSLSLSINEGDVAAGHYSQDLVTKELTHIAKDRNCPPEVAPCWLACFDEKPDCPQGLFAKKTG